MAKLQRYDPCPCGSGKKYKWCCEARNNATPAGPLVAESPHFFAEHRPGLDQAVDRILCRIESGAGKLVEAELNSLFDQHPSYHMTNYAMGVFHAFVEKDPAKAVPYFETAVKILPPLAEAHFNLGLARRQLTDIPRAVASFRAAVRYSTRGDGIAELAQEELRWLEELILETSPLKSLDAYVANAQRFESAFDALVAHQFQQAINLFESVLREYPNHVASYGNLALAHAGLGQKATAMSCFDRALQLDPQYEPALQNRKLIAEMREGVPFVPDDIREIEFYREKVDRKKRVE